MDFTRTRISRVVFITFLFSLPLLFSCAEIAPPPGGEVDKTPPYIIGSSPTDGATDIPFNNQIIISLSERVVKPDKQTKAVFITPRPKIAPEIKWKANQIIITLFDSIRTDQTYIVSLSAAIRDLRNNPIDSAGLIAFSTGPKINTGQLRGVIYDNDKPAGNLLVGLYEPASFKNDQLIDSTYPEYIAQTNNNGNFQFKYLPDRKFRLIAFEDKNRNELYDMGEERFAVSDRPIIINDEALFLDDLRCYLTTQDTLPPKIVSAGMTADRLIRLTLNRAVPTALIKNKPGLLKLTSKTDSTTYASNQFAQASEAETATMHFYFPQLPIDSYTVALNLDSLPITFDRIVYKEGEDKKDPEIVAVTPDSKPVFESDFDLSVTFSEPLDTTKMTDQSIVIMSRDSVALDYDKRFVTPFDLKIDPHSIEPGMLYTLRLTEFELVDLSCNAVGDSLSQFYFSVLNRDSLGSISGALNNLFMDKKELPYRLDFMKVENQKVYSYYYNDTSFSAALPPGKYLISGFIDENDNREFDKGSLVPYRLAETFINHPDTIAVRARFETGDVALSVK